MRYACGCRPEPKGMQIIEVTHRVSGGVILFDVKPRGIVGAIALDSPRCAVKTRTMWSGDVFTYSMTPKVLFADA